MGQQYLGIEIDSLPIEKQQMLLRLIAMERPSKVSTKQQPSKEIELPLSESLRKVRDHSNSSKMSKEEWERHLSRCKNQYFKGDKKEDVFVGYRGL